ncbi:hypothetical protein K457DRAFT_637814 [Linnemannia elongata AG-77]|uniref:Uncharacterized protein n=1 Tax=Linnemannia elongata AG-77 TaxID=1314771 RepID=A0A197JRV8_9FUNG|nr:hypothetical protein K457DRAFT_637814 [Linnemannia elongata AG-77]
MERQGCGVDRVPLLSPSLCLLHKACGVPVLSPGSTNAHPLLLFFYLTSFSVNSLVFTLSPSSVPNVCVWSPLFFFLSSLLCLPVCLSNLSLFLYVCLRACLAVACFVVFVLLIVCCLIANAILFFLRVHCCYSCCLMPLFSCLLF